jgi:hypothetical protein
MLDLRYKFSLMNYRVSLVFVLFLLKCTTLLLAQSTEGKVIYDVSYPENTFDSISSKNLPHDCTYYFNDRMMRIDIGSEADMTRVLLDNEKEVLHVLTDANGNKMDLYFTRKEIEKAGLGANGSMTLTGDSRVIAGYDCKKAVITRAGNKLITVWFTDKIKPKNAYWNMVFRDIEGLLMEFTTEIKGITTYMTAREVILGNPGNDIFLIPAGYTPVTAGELKKMTEGK